MRLLAAAAVAASVVPIPGIANVLRVADVDAVAALSRLVAVLIVMGGLHFCLVLLPEATQRMNVWNWQPVSCL